MSIFDLEDDVELVKHKSEMGLVKSKSVARSNSNRSLNNRLLALEQSVLPSSLSSAYELQPAPLSIPTKLYLIAGGGDWTKFGIHTKEALRSLQKDMVYLLPEFWETKKKEPGDKIIDARCSIIKKEIEKGVIGDSDPSTVRLFLNGSFVSQLLFWAAILKESIDEVFHYSSYIDDSNVFKKMIKKGMDESIKTHLNPIFKPNISELSKVKIPPEFFPDLAEKVTKELVSKQLVGALKKIKLKETITLNPLLVIDLDKDFQMTKMEENSLAYRVAERETGLVVSPADRERFKKEQKELALLAENSSFIAIGKPSNKINQDIASSLKSILGLALTIPKDHHYSKASITKINENKERAAKILTQLQLALGSLAYCDTQGDLKLDHEKLNKTQKFLQAENGDGMVSTLVAAIDASVGTWDGKKVCCYRQSTTEF